MTILNSAQSVLAIAFIISIGYFLTLKGWLDDNVSDVFSKLVINISLPALMIYNMLNNYDSNQLKLLIKGLVIPLLSMFICYLISILVSKILNVPPKRRGVFQSMFFTSNTMMIGLPINLSLFGNESVPYVLIYYVANNIFFWTIGVYSITKDAQGKCSKIFNVKSLKKIFSPPLIGFIVGVILVQFNIKPPKFIIDSCKYLGNLTTPLALLFIGITIRSMGLSRLKFDKDAATLLFGRFVVSPLTIFYLATLFPIPLLMKNVFVIQASMPAIAQSAIIAKAYDADYEYSVIMITLTTIISLITIPIYMFFLS